MLVLETRVWLNSGWMSGPGILLRILYETHLLILVRMSLEKHSSLSHFRCRILLDLPVHDAYRTYEDYLLFVRWIRETCKLARVCDVIEFVPQRICAIFKKHNIILLYLITSATLWFFLPPTLTHKYGMVTGSQLKEFFTFEMFGVLFSCFWRQMLAKIQLLKILNIIKLETPCRLWVRYIF